MRLNRLGRVTARLAIAALLLTGMAVLPEAIDAGALPTYTVSGTARGQALSVTTSVANPDPLGVITNPSISAQADASRAFSSIDSSTFGNGAVVADGEAVGLRADSPGYVHVSLAQANTIAPSSETTDSGTKAQASVAGVLNAATLETTSSASTQPSSINDAKAATAQILPGGVVGSVRPAADTSNILGHSESAQPSAEVAESKANSAITLDTLGLPVPVTITGITATAAAKATGNPATSSATATCNVLSVTVGASTISPVACPRAPIVVPNPLPMMPPLATIEFGKPTIGASNTSVAGDGNSATASIAAVTITIAVPLGADPEVIQLGIAEAVATRTLIATPDPCLTAPEATGAASAEGNILRVRDALSIVEADQGLSQAEADERRLPYDSDDATIGDKAARAAGVPLQLESFPAPVRPDGADSSDLVEVVDSHDAARPAAPGESYTVATVSGVPLTSDLLSFRSATVSSSADATTNPGTTDKAPDAAATTNVQQLDAVVDLPGTGPDLPVSSTTADTKARANVATGSHLPTASATSTLQRASATIGTTAISATLIDSTTTASAGPGSAAADTDFTVATVTVGGTTLSAFPDNDADGNPDPAIIDLGVATVYVGEVVKSVSPATNSASISVNPVRVVVPGGGTTSPQTSVVFGHTEAKALYIAAPPLDPRCDTTPPRCVLVATPAGPPRRFIIEVQDPGTGLRSIEVVKIFNASMPMPTITPGTTALYTLVATKVDPLAPMIVQLKVTDVAGNVTFCDPVQATVSNVGPSASQTFSGVPAEEDTVTITNGSPGIRSLGIVVNGTSFRVHGLTDGSVRVVDISSATVAGSPSTITLTGSGGHPGGSASVLIAEG